MSIQSDVKLVTLEEMRFISVHGFGEHPEDIAIEKMRTWVNAHNLTEHVEEYRFFGFNNPGPLAGSPNYGYEQWMTLAEDYIAEEEDKVKKIKGGLFAMLGFRNATPEMFGPVWEALVEWRQDSGYEYDDSRQWLEECLTPKVLLNIEKGTFNFDCYMPIKKINE